MKKTGEKKQDANTRFSKHAIRRASQRGVSKSMINLLIKHGKVIKKQGLNFYYITKKSLLYFDLEIQKKIRNLIVIVSCDGEVITCYKNEKAIKRIKHKPKRLIVNNIVDIAI